MSRQVATSPGTMADGRKTVTTKGTAVALASAPTPVHQIDITAETDNTDKVCVGASTVVASLTTRRGTYLNAGDTYTLYDVDLSEIYIDSLVDTEGVTWTAVEL